MRKVFGFGETVLDIIFKDGQPVAAKPGGSVLNAFVSLGRLGWNPSFISEYANDDVGILIDDFLRENGVDTRYVNRFSDGKSALALAFLDEQKNANYTFYKDFPEERLQELPGDLKEDDIIMFGSIYASSREVRHAVLRFLEMGRERDCLILYDPNFRKAHLHELDELKPRIEENIEYADVIRGSDEDFKLVFGIEDPMEIRDRFDLGSKLFLYTRNADGVHVIHDTEELEVPAEPIEPLSTIGAGDNFNAGIVHFLLENGVRRMDSLTRKDLLNMAGTGVRFASHVCMQFDNYISRDFARNISRT